MGMMDGWKDHNGVEMTLTRTLAQMIGNQPAGLSGFLELFKQKGLGDVAGSWVRPGENDPLTPQDVQLVLGVSRIDELAKTIGQPPGVTSEKLATIIPPLVDKLTPAGVVPEGDILAQELDDLQRGL